MCALKRKRLMNWAETFVSSSQLNSSRDSVEVQTNEPVEMIRFDDVSDVNLYSSHATTI